MNGLEKEELKLPNILELHGSDLTDIMKIISSNFLYIVAKWKTVYDTDEIKFYC